MSPVAPMPYAACVGANGLKACVMVDSGELSITRVLPMALLLVPEELELELELDPELEHAASPAASTPAAATAKSRLWLCKLLISLVFLSITVGGSMSGSCVHLLTARRRAPGRRHPGASRPRRG